jgi:hypothetical protein
MSAPSMFPLATLQSCSVDEANALLIAWQHRMGPISRPMDGGEEAHVLLHLGEPIAVTVHSTLIREGVGGGAPLRANAREHRRTVQTLRVAKGSLPGDAAYVA